MKKNPDFITEIEPIVESGSKSSNEQIEIEEPKLSEYERIRQRNIEERENLFQKMKISQLKAQVAVGIPKDKTCTKH